MDIKVTVCVITYNCIKYLPVLLDSIRNSSFKYFRLLFVDNNSSDGTVEYLENYELEKTVIKLPENTGHSYAANIALKECTTRYLILMDHDTIAHEDLFRNLYLEAEREKDSEFTVFAPKIVDKSRNETYFGGEFHYIGKTYTNREMPDSPELGMISSTSPLVDLEKLPDDLTFDEDLFIYWNDADFFYRLRAFGRKIKLVPEAVVVHLGGTKDYSHRTGSEYSPVRAFYVARNHRLFVIKNYSLMSILIFMPCFLLYELYNIAFCLKKKVFIKGYLRSVVDTFRLLLTTIKKRSAFQEARKIAEKDLVGWYRLDYTPGVIVTELEKRSIRFLDQIFKRYFLLVKTVFWK
ncbi:MAG: glycosyltransferase [Candidatus Omnitrophota bacterium]|nr:glycosyltransferase [Candidatus Omnitrophota bacterium]